METMYGDESPASPLRRAMPPSVSREDLVKEYELIYTPKDRPTSEKLANGGETMDIPPPPMPSRSVQHVVGVGGGILAHLSSLTKSGEVTCSQGFTICFLKVSFSRLSAWQPHLHLQPYGL